MEAPAAAAPLAAAPSPLGRLRESLRAGSWLIPSRVRAYPAMLLAVYLAVVVAGLATAGGPMRAIDPFGRPLGTDFSEVWVAGRSALGGDPARPYDPPAHYAAEQALFGPATPFYGWHYPPYFLFVAAAVALLPYVPALLLWQAATLALAAGLVRRVLPRPGDLLPILAFPAVFVNLGHGQNGFLTAALLTGGLLALERRPLLAGALFAGLAYKPQFALLIPLALLAGRHWRALAAGALALALMTVATLAAFGAGAWRAFAASLAFSREVVLEQGQTGWEKIQSPFAAVRSWGMGVEGAYLVQGAATLLAAALLWRLWRSGADARLKGAGLAAAALLATPYVLDYDLAALGPALALLVARGRERGFRPYEASLLAFAWAAPLVARGVAQATLVPLGLLAVAAVLALAVTGSAGEPRRSPA